MKCLLKVCGAIQNNVFGTVLLSLRLLWSADVNPSNSDCATLRAMTSPERESAVILFLVFMQLLGRCGAFGYMQRNEFRCYNIVRT